MGDRTDCELILPFPPSEEFLAHLEACGWEPNDIYIERFLTFEQVNYGEPGDEIVAYLAEHRIPYVWSWGPGDDYGPGIHISDGENRNSFATNYDGHICLTLNKAASLVMLDQARHWDRIRQNITNGIL